MAGGSHRHPLKGNRVKLIGLKDVWFNPKSVGLLNVAFVSTPSRSPRNNVKKTVFVYFMKVYNEIGKFKQF